MSFAVRPRQLPPTALAGALAAVLVAALLGPTPAVADPASHRAAALALLDAAGVSQAMVAGVNALVDAQVKQDPKMVTYKDVVDSWKARRITWANMADDLSKLYMETFTEEELRQLTAFYQTPLGKKAVAKIPDLTKNAAQMASSVAFKFLPELQTQLEARRAAIEAKLGTK